MSVIPASGPEIRAAVIASALLALLLAQLFLPIPLKLPGLTSGDSRSPPSVAVAPAIPPYPGIETAALFAPDRQPEVAAGTPAATADLSGYAVLGVALSPRGASALLKGPAGVTTLHPGQSLAGWSVAMIGRDRVDFVREGKHRTLSVDSPPETAAPQPQGVESMH